MKRLIVCSFFILGLISSLVYAKDNVRELFSNNSAIIYTINIRNFSAVDNNNDGVIDVELGDEIGNFVSAKDKLNDLKKDGINTIYLLPITPTGKLKALGTAGSLYAMDEFDRVANEYDKKDNDKTVYQEIKEFINEAHKLNMNVIVDLPSCGSYDLSLRKPNWFILDKQKEALIPADWTDVRLFKIYNENKNLNKTTLDNFKSFVDMVQILGFDGIRADVAAIKPPNFWKEIIDYSRKKNKDFFFLAEANVEWTNPAPNGVSHYSSVDELLEAGFDSFYAPWSDFKNIDSKEKFDNKIKKHLKVLKRNKNKSAISAFATHDQQAPILRGKNYWEMVLWLNSTMPSNMYFLDGFNVADDFIYQYEGEKSIKSFTDDEYYYVHSGMFDIFNFTAPVRIKNINFKDEYLKAINFRKENNDLITKGQFSLLKNKNKKVFSYSIRNKSKELIVIGSLDEDEIQKTTIKTKYLKKQNLFNIVQTHKYPKLNKEFIDVELEPLEIQVYLINLVGSQAI